MESTKTIAVMSYEEWVEKFKPIPVEEKINDESDDRYRYDIKDPRILKYDPSKIWTLLDCEGLSIITRGWYFVNREAYFITEVPHDETTPDVEFWGHDDEMELMLDNFKERFQINIDGDTITVSEDDEILEELTIEREGPTSLDIQGYVFLATLNPETNELTIKGVFNNSEKKQEVKINLFQN